MTLSTQTSEASYSGNDVTTEFSVPFKFNANADIVAILATAAGAESTLVNPTHYSLTGAGSANGGTLTMVTAPATTETLIIYRDPAIVQEVDYVDNSAFPAETHEGALDLLTMICQRLQTQIDRAVLVPISSSTNPADLLDELAADVVSAAASAATATTQAGIANTARIAAEDARDASAAASAVALESEFHVSAYGAVGDGTTDDGPAIQLACDAAETAGGGTVLFEPGKTYLIDGYHKTVNGYKYGFTVASNITLDLNGATIKAGANLALTHVCIGNKSGDTGLDTRVDTNIKIINGVLDGSGRTYPAWDANTDPPTYGGLSQANARGHLVDMWSVNGFEISGCEIKNHDSITIAIGGCKDVLVARNYVHDCGKVDDVSGGFWIARAFPTNNTYSDTVRIVDNIFENLDRLPFLCGGGVRNVVVSGNNVKTVKEGGLYFPAPISQVVVTGNTIDGVVMSDISASGIEIGEGNGFTIVGNTINNTGRSAIAAVGLTNSTISGNVFRNYGMTIAYPGGPQAYAASLSGAVPVAYKTGTLIFTGDTATADHVLISANTFMDDQTPVTGQYCVGFAGTGASPVTVGKVKITGNDFRTGGATDTIYYGNADSTGSTEINVRNNSDSLLKTTGLYGYGVQSDQQYRQDSSGGNTAVGNYSWVGLDTDGNRTVYAQEQAIAYTATAGAELGRIYWYTTDAGTSTLRMYIQRGLVVGAPTGGDKGAGTINAVAVYDDNVLLTCYPFEFWLTGKVDLEFWDRITPDRYDQDGMLIEVRQHVEARAFAEVAEDRLDTEKYVQYLKYHGHLPALPGREQFAEGCTVSTGELLRKLWEVCDVQAIHIAKMHERIKALEEKS